MTTLSVSQLREQIKDIGNRVAYTGEHILVENHKKPFFAIIPCSDLELLELLEDKIDLESALNALKSNDFVSWKEAKKEMGL